MVKLRTVYRCTDCGVALPKWAGRCGACGAWNSLVEDVEVSAPYSAVEFVSLSSGMALVPPGEPKPINALDAKISIPQPSGLEELDRVLGGGLVPGSVTLLGGEPGIGKSTLLLQLLAAWPTKTLYVTAEESAQQVRLRAERLGAVKPDLWLVAEMSLTNISCAAPALVFACKYTFTGFAPPRARQGARIRQAFVMPQGMTNVRPHPQLVRKNLLCA